MSFATNVKDELARVKPMCGICPQGAYSNCMLCDKAKLSALVQSKGILKFHGGGKYSVEISTDSAGIARFAIRDLHEFYNLDTNLVLRKNVLNNTSNCLIELLQGDKLINALCDMGILERQANSNNVNITEGIKREFMENDFCAAAYLRGAFMGSGYVSEPTGNFHFEIVVGHNQQAEDIVGILAKKNIKAGIYSRRSYYMVYIKSGQGIVDFLAYTGAHKSATEMENIRVLKSIRNIENRHTNFEYANIVRSSQAAVDQLNAIQKVAQHYGVKNLSPGLREFIKLRIQNPTASLKDLGELANPPLSKSAINSRLRRLKQMEAKIG